jgi:hypothetical protein
MKHIFIYKFEKKVLHSLMYNVRASRKSWIVVQDSRAGLRSDVTSGNIMNLTEIWIGLAVVWKEEENKLE